MGLLIQWKNNLSKLNGKHLLNIINEGEPMPDFQNNH